MAMDITKLEGEILDEEQAVGTKIANIMARIENGLMLCTGISGCTALAYYLPYHVGPHMAENVDSM